MSDTMDISLIAIYSLLLWISKCSYTFPKMDEKEFLWQFRLV